MEQRQKFFILDDCDIGRLSTIQSLGGMAYEQNLSAIFDKALQLSKSVIWQIVDMVHQKGTVRGIPYLKPAILDLSVFCTGTT